MIRSTLKVATCLAALTTLSPSLAFSQEAMKIDVPAQPLATAIAELGRETGLQVGITSELSAGKQSTGVRGVMTARQALAAMLQGTGLQATSLGADGARIAQAPTTGQLSTTDNDLIADEIIVRGELIQRSVQDSQTSAVVVTGEELDQRGETSLDQTIERVPGVNQANNLTIRGIADDGDLGSATTSSTISVTSDGVRLSDYRNVNRTQISTWDVQQVEVLRGPQSTQSGRNALAGAIIVDSADPTYSPEYKARVGVTEIQGTSDEGTGYQAAFVLNTPIVEDEIAVRLSADKRETLDRSTDAQTVRGKLRLDPSDSMSFGVEFTHISNTAEFEDGGSSQLELRSPSLSIGYDITDELTFTSRSQYTEANPGFFALVPSLNATALRDREYETIEQELQLTYETGSIRAIGGLFYTNLSENSVLEVVQGFITSTLDEEIETNNYAIYGEIEFDLTPEWTLIAGARYDVEDVKNTSTAAISSPFFNASETGAFDNTYSAFLPKLGAVYNFSDDVSLGGTYQRGYRAGGVGVTVSATSPPSTFEFEPEFTDTFELVFRSQSGDGNRTLNANVFYTRWTDQQVQDQDVFGNFFVSNAANSNLWGAEVDISQFVTDELELFASAAYVNTRFDDYVRDGVQLSGNEFTGAPEWTAAFGANYSFPNGLTIGGDVNYTSSTFSDAANSPELRNDAVWITNLNASYDFGNGAELTGYVRNLFDEEYTTARSPNGPEFDNLGARREVGLLLTITF